MWLDGALVKRDVVISDGKVERIAERIDATDDMVEMDGLLLKKIEELTLYTIELNKLIAEQQKIIEELRSK